MNSKYLVADVFAFSLLNKINQPIINWDLAPLTGKGLYSRHDSIAYLEIKMYKSQGEISQNTVVFNIHEEHTINKRYPGYKPDIEKGLIFFLRYMAALKGETVQLTFEINDIAFDETSTRHNPFEKAVMYTIVNCFDKDMLSFNEAMVATLKGNAGCKLETQPYFIDP